VVPTSLAPAGSRADHECIRAVFGRAAAAQDSPGNGGADARRQRADRFFVVLSRAADHSPLWIAISAGLAAGGQRARHGATRGLAAVAVTSAATSLLLKPASGRQRPEHSFQLVLPPGPFPSGHSASAFAFAIAVSWQLPGLTPVLLPLAGTLAWSRVRTGVHHRDGVLLGSAIGAGIGIAVTAGPASGAGCAGPARRARYPRALRDSPRQCWSPARESRAAATSLPPGGRYAAGVWSSPRNWTSERWRACASCSPAVIPCW